MNEITFLDPAPEATPKVGQYYLNTDKGTVHILSRVGTGLYALINLENGALWADRAEVPKKVFGEEAELFTLVRKPFVVTPGEV